MARRLNISTVAVSKSAARGAEIAKKEGFELTKVNKLTMSLQTQRKGGYDDR